MNINFGLALFLCIATPIFAAASYDVRDIEQLYTSGKFEDAYDHLQDIAPLQRPPAWNQLVKDIVIAYANGMLEKDPGASRLILKKSAESYPFLTKDKVFKNAYVQTSIKAIHSDGSIIAYNDEKRAFIDDVTRIDESAIYPLVLDADITDDRGILLDYISKQPEKFKKDDKVKTYVINAAITCNEDSHCMLAMHISKITNLVAILGLQNDIDKYNQEKSKKLVDDDQAFLDSTVRGVTSYKNKTLVDEIEIIQNYHTSTGNFRGKNDIVFLLSGLIYTVGQLDRRLDSQVIPLLEKAESDDITSAESLILSVQKPVQKWFSSYDDAQHFKNLEKFAPNIVKKIRDEHEKLKSNPKQQSNYLSQYGVKKLDEIFTNLKK